MRLNQLFRHPQQPTQNQSGEDTHLKPRRTRSFDCLRSIPEDLPITVFPIKYSLPVFFERPVAKLKSTTKESEQLVLVNELKSWIARLPQKVINKMSLKDLAPLDIALNIAFTRTLWMTQNFTQHNSVAHELRECLAELADLRTEVFGRWNDLDVPTHAPAFVLFENTVKLKIDNPPSPQEMESYFQTKLASFKQAGGDLASIKDFSKEVLKSIPSGVLCEWVVLANNSAKISRADLPPSPGHLVMAGGQSVLGAGSLRIYKDDSGNPTLAILGGFSGTYRTDFKSNLRMLPHLKQCGVADDLIVLEGVESAGNRVVKELILKKLDYSEDKIREIVSEMESLASAWH